MVLKLFRSGLRPITLSFYLRSQQKDDAQHGGEYASIGENRCLEVLENRI